MSPPASVRPLARRDVRAAMRASFPARPRRRSLRRFPPATLSTAFCRRATNGEYSKGLASAERRRLRRTCRRAASRFARGFDLACSEMYLRRVRFASTNVPDVGSCGVQRLGTFRRNVHRTPRCAQKGRPEPRGAGACRGLWAINDCEIGARRASVYRGVGAAIGASPWRPSRSAMGRPAGARGGVRRGRAARLCV